MVATKKSTTKKETVKKKTVKKKTAKSKSRSKKKSPAVKLDKIAKNHYFVRSDGKDISSLVDLARQLDTMADDVFYHHVNEARNDFATWIHDVFKQTELAAELNAIKNRHHTTYVVMRHIIKRV